MDKWLKRKVASVDAKDLAEAGSSEKTEMEPASVPAHKKRDFIMNHIYNMDLRFLPVHMTNNYLYVYYVMILWRLKA